MSNQVINSGGHDSFWIQERAASEYARIVSQVGDTYFAALRDEAQRGSMTAGAQMAMQVRQQSAAQQGVITGAGLALGAPFGAPGLIFGGIASSFANNFIGNRSELAATQWEQIGMGQELGGMAASRAGRGVDSGWYYQSYFGSMAKPAGANQLISVYAGTQGNPYSAASPASVESFFRGTISDQMREGSAQLAAEQLGATMGLQALQPGRMGMSPESYRSAMTGGTYTPSTRMTAKEFYNRQPWSNRFGQKFTYEEIEANAASAGTFNRIYDAYVGQSKGSSGSVTDSEMRALLMAGGPQAYGMLVQSGAMTETQAGGARDFVKRMSTMQAGIGTFSSLEGTLSFGGRAGATGAAKAAGLQENVLGNWAAAYAREAYNADGTVKPGMELVAEQAAKFGLAGVQAGRRAAEYRYGAAGEGVGMHEAYARSGMASAEFYGDSAQARRAFGQMGSGVHADIVRTRERLAAGGMSVEQETELRTHMVDLLRQETQLRQESVRVTNQWNAQVAQMGAGVAASVQHAAYSMGAGGQAALGYAATSYSAARGSALAAYTEAAAIASQIKARGGDPTKSTVYMSALDNYAAKADLATTAYLGMAEAPVSLGLRREEANLSYAARVMETVPGSYGNIRGAQMGLMRNYNRQADEIRGQMQTLARSGQMTEPLQAEFEGRLRDVGMRQAGVFQELSYGWEHRLVSEMIGTPGSFSFAAPFASYRAAVGAGVRHPGFGSNKSDLPFFLHQAQMFSNVGSTGMPEGFRNTALTGGHGSGVFGGPSVLSAAPTRVTIDGGMVISGTLQLSDGSRGRIQATVHANRQDTSPAAHAEGARHYQGARER